MYGEPISEIQNMRYRGYYICNKTSNKTHMTIQKQTKNMAIIKLKEESDFKDPDANIKLKVQLYKSYVRPILLSGLDSMSLNIDETKNIKNLSRKH